MYKLKLLFLIFIITLLSNFFISYNVEACKDIIACGNATEGDYNLLLKVRDPSRLGLQVLCIVPEDYEYTYRYPWTGKPMSCKVLHKFIGVVTKGDNIPNIVKAGMSLSDVGIAYGDADTDSRWINPTKYAWDDFDWIRYACEKANDEDDAVSLMTMDVVKKMHATGVSENLFVVGPKKGYVIEADAFRYKTREIVDGIEVMSNYPKDLWKTQREKKFPISKTFDTVIEKEVGNKGIIRLNSLYGVRIVEIGENYIYVVPISFYYILKTKSSGVITKINLGERETVGYFSVELIDIKGNKAKVRVCNIFKAWEEKILKNIQSKYGSITVKDMINWSRLHDDDLDGLRPICEDFYEYESVAIYKIPKEDYEIMSIGWFSPNHACSSIYVPFHICDNDVYDPYETGEAAELSLSLLKKYGHGTLSAIFSNTEGVFLNEIEYAEHIVETIKGTQKTSEFLTQIDTGMQRQAYLTEQIWMDICSESNEENKKMIIDSLKRIWENNYSTSLSLMKDSVYNLINISNTYYILDKICEIALNICKSKIITVNVMGKNYQNAQLEYENGNDLIKKDEYIFGIEHLEKAFNECEYLIKGQTISSSYELEKNNKLEIVTYILVIILLVIAILLFFRLKSF